MSRAARSTSARGRVRGYEMVLETVQWRTPGGPDRRFQLYAPRLSLKIGNGRARVVREPETRLWKRPAHQVCHARRLGAGVNRGSSWRWT